METSAAHLSASISPDSIPKENARPRQARFKRNTDRGARVHDQLRANAMISFTPLMITYSATRAAATGQHGRTDIIEVDGIGQRRVVETTAAAGKRTGHQTQSQRRRQADALHCTIEHFTFLTPHDVSCGQKTLPAPISPTWRNSYSYLPRPRSCALRCSSSSIKRSKSALLRELVFEIPMRCSPASSNAPISSWLCASPLDRRSINSSSSALSCRAIARPPANTTISSTPLMITYNEISAAAAPTTAGPPCPNENASVKIE